jgi:hypothetical protein
MCGSMKTFSIFSLWPNPAVERTCSKSRVVRLLLSWASQHMQKIFLVISLLAITTFSASAEVIGYVRDGKFHPLVTVDGKRIAEVQSRKLQMVGTIRNAFEPSPESLRVAGQEDYEDGFSNKLGRFGKVQGKAKDNQFYLQGSSSPMRAKVPSKELKRSFYRHFSNDPWGRHFAESGGSKKPVAALEKKRDVQVLYATDLNANGKPELWITYRLMYGEIGRMVWEQRGINEWVSLANHCFNCD